MEDLLKLLRLCSCDAASIPRSKYMLEKAFEHFVDKSEYHHYCGFCSSYIGKSMSKDSELKCQICSSTQTVRQSLELGNFFIYIPLKDQLKALLENEPITNDYTEQTRDGITDISDGKLYKYLKSVSNSFFSLSFNCDGVPVFQSSKFSIWPLLCSVNEVPPEGRDKNVILCALWFGSSKPLMASFLKPFVEECKSLGQTGLQWQDPVEHTVKTAKVYALCSICDAVARPLLQNFKQFNGEYGCVYCLHTGVQVRKGNGTVRVYPCLEEMPDLRDHDTTVKIGEIAKSNKRTVLGIKGQSPIVDLPNFDLINGMVPDYMHFQSLYGEDQMTYNMHALLHLAKSVENLGALWAQSAFMFESYNGYLLKQVKSSNAVSQQLCKELHGLGHYHTSLRPAYLMMSHLK
ncbi:uncharacterized protein [Misgurnus anguillicaudatus]|uniref:uncharacterized protein n=1 Tax=Misgurnus anguillicaudatus TaxID=75329 RepID=UPI003CCF3E47